MKVDNVYKFEIYGRFVDCRVLALHALGTVDVGRLSDGKCFRVSGLQLEQSR